jgi:hypothetical protein
MMEQFSPTDDPEEKLKRIESNKHFENWSVQNLLDPVVMWPMLDLIFTPAFPDVPKLSYVLDRAELAAEDSKYLQESIAFFGKSAAPNISKQPKSGEDSKDISEEATGTMADLV